MDLDIDLDEILKILTALKAEDYTTAEIVWNQLSEKTPEIVEELRSNQKWINLRDAVESIFILKGANAFKTGQYEIAEKSFRLVLSLEPKIKKVQSNLAFVYNRMGRYFEAENIFKDILKEEPEDIEIQKWFVRMLIKQQKWYEAEQYLQKMRKKDPNNRDILQLIDQIYQEKQQISTPPSHGEIGQLLDKGQAEFKLGKYTEAITYYQQALQLAPNTSIIHTAIGSAHYFLGEYEVAEQFIRDALKIDPTSSEAKFFLQKIREVHLNKR